MARCGKGAMLRATILALTAGSALSLEEPPSPPAAPPPPLAPDNAELHGGGASQVPDWPPRVPAPASGLAEDRVCWVGLVGSRTVERGLAGFVTEGWVSPGTGDP